eukprot:GSMAST32.ASY1.ANO1.576.1 assembled CDS
MPMIALEMPNRSLISKLLFGVATGIAGAALMARLSQRRRLLVRKKRVCVTGASGFFASELVRQLLERGYHVRGTVRKFTGDRIKHLQSLPGALQRLKLFEADLSRPDSFNLAISDCCCVFHTASPFFLAAPSVAKGNLEYNSNNMLPPAIEGTIGILSACAQSRTYVFIMNFNLIFFHTKFRKPDSHIFTENDWSSDAELLAHEDWYALSKLRAERAAWDFIKTKSPPFKLKLNIVLLRKNKYVLQYMNPTLILGPALQPKLNQSLQQILQLINGKSCMFNFFSNSSFKAFIDVRDVALAHIKAHELETVDNERVLLIGDVVPWSKIYSTLALVEPAGIQPQKKDFSQNLNQNSNQGKSNVPEKLKYSCKKAEEKLEMNFRKVEEMLICCHCSFHFKFIFIFFFIKNSVPNKNKHQYFFTIHIGTVESLKEHHHYEGLSNSVVFVPSDK